MKDDLTMREQENVRAALRALHGEYRTWQSVAYALPFNIKWLSMAAVGSRHVTVTLASRTARLAGVSLSDVLDGRYPVPVCCMRCGHPHALPE